MIADDVWQNQSQIFWNYVRIISENLGYSRNGKVLRHSEADIRRALTILNLSVDIDATIDQLAQYFHFRANLIETTMATYLQTPDEARMLFEEVVAHYTTSVTSRFNQGGQENTRVYTVKNGVPVIAPYNKQKGHKREIDYLTAISNILISHHLAGEDFDQDPHRLPIVTESGIIQGAMSRRMDGAYPSCVNPLAVWEFKSYYYTTTFGSKISDAVYIASLDGYERDEIFNNTARRIYTTLFLDAYSAWLKQGKSYLCRIVDLLYRGLIDDLVIGSEVLTAIPEMVKKWRSSKLLPD